MTMKSQQAMSAAENEQSSSQRRHQSLKDEAYHGGSVAGCRRCCAIDFKLLNIGSTLTF